jgi:hypothetical protein
VPDDSSDQIDQLAGKYIGSTAANYHEVRANTPRRKAELEAIDAFLTRIQPASLLDIPCGTGSLFEAYLQHGPTSVLGIDVSEDMLAEAAGTAAGQSEAVSLRVGSVFDRELLDSLDPVDLVCCIRFLNWIERAEADAVVRSLKPLATRWMIIGITLEPTDLGVVARTRGRLDVARRDRRDHKRGRVSPKVHPEQWFRGLVSELGLEVLESRRTFTDVGRENHLFLLQV